VFDEAVHPEDVVVLSFELKLVADEEAQFFLGFALELSECFLEDGVELLLYVGCFGVDLFYF
jgi:hypothetical protein